ncbi:hypothetical protein JTB14_016165 [Gonioctena quinquepunctata]|nr:hypothetical protein JTB14_016165 [Gonioctena quinquepunctata]
MKPDLTTLPSTGGAVKPNSFLTYHQVHLWLGVPPSTQWWGTELELREEEGPTSYETLRVGCCPWRNIEDCFCRCMEECDTGRCSCRRASLICSHARIAWAIATTES